MNLSYQRCHRGEVRRARGFTLIELMITVAVIGILSAIAYPSYRESIAKGRRAQAAGVVQAGSQWMERFYAENFRYDQNTASVSASTLFAIRFAQAPAAPDAAMYNLSLTNLSATTMTIVATRTGAMAGDKCGNLTVNQLGVKGVSNTSGFASDQAAIAYCWK